MRYSIPNTTGKSPSLPDLHAMTKSSRKRKLEGNTYLVEKPDGIAIRLWDTEIIRFYDGVAKNRKITIESGGFRTKLTKARLNKYLPEWLSISQENYKWSIINRLTGKKIDYYDGMTIDMQGNLLSGEKVDSFVKKRESVRKYISGFVKAVSERKIGLPSGGDCWYCAMKTENGESLGDKAKNEHLKNHIEEKYYVPSLLFNALNMYNHGGYYAFLVASYLSGKTDEKNSIEWFCRQSLGNYFKNRMNEL